jgi:hypothetical protein
MNAIRQSHPFQIVVELKRGYPDYNGVFRCDRLRGPLDLRRPGNVGVDAGEDAAEEEHAMTERRRAYRHDDGESHY